MDDHGFSVTGTPPDDMKMVPMRVRDVFEVREAAIECAFLLDRAGWRHIECGEFVVQGQPMRLIDWRAESNQAKPRRAAKKCPAGWEIGPHLYAWADEKCPGVNLTAETEKFRDHTFSRAISDWDGAWRNWVRGANERLPHNRTAPASFADQARTRVAKLTGEGPAEKKMGGVQYAAKRLGF